MLVWNCSQLLCIANRKMKPSEMFYFLRPILLVIFSLLFLEPVQATDYFLSPDGSDMNTGTSKSDPWQTLDRINRVHLEPDDRVLLKGGRIFTGSLVLDEEDRGTVSAPIVITSYDGDRAMVVTEVGSGVLARNTAGVAISNVDFMAGRGSGLTTTGLEFYSDSDSHVLLEGIWIHNVDVSGFGRDGVSIGGWNGANGFRHIWIENARVHHNGLNGLTTYGEQPFAIEDVHLKQVVAHDNNGSLDAKPNSGSGIILGSVRGGTVEMCLAYNNGASGNAGIGIWAYASSHIIMRYNESHNNHTAGDADGSGFALDGGMTDSVMEFNYSHDNDGSGFALNQYAGATLWARNAVRNNISINDGRRNSYGGIQVWSGERPLKDAMIEQNVVIVGPAFDGTPSALVFRGATENFTFGSNAFFSFRHSSLLPTFTSQAGASFFQNRCWTNDSVSRDVVSALCESLYALR